MLMPHPLRYPCRPLETAFPVGQDTRCCRGSWTRKPSSCPASIGGPPWRCASQCATARPRAPTPRPPGTLAAAGPGHGIASSARRRRNAARRARSGADRRRASWATRPRRWGCTGCGRTRRSRRSQSCPSWSRGTLAPESAGFAVRAARRFGLFPPRTCAFPGVCPGHARPLPGASSESALKSINGVPSSGLVAQLLWGGSGASSCGSRFRLGALSSGTPWGARPEQPSKLFHCVPGGQRAHLLGPLGSEPM